MRAVAVELDPLPLDVNRPEFLPAHQTKHPDPSEPKATTSTTTKPTATARKNKTPTLTLRVQYKGAGPTHVFAIQLKDTILSIKQQLENINGVPTTAQRIVFAGKDVLNNATVEEMNLHIVPKSFVLKVWPAKGKP